MAVVFLSNNQGSPPFCPTATKANQAQDNKEANKAQDKGANEAQDHL